MSKGDYVSALTRFILACREKANITRKGNEKFNSKPHAKNGISHYFFFDVDIRLLKLKVKSDSWRSGRRY